MIYNVENKILNLYIISFMSSLIYNSHLWKYIAAGVHILEQS